MRDGRTVLIWRSRIQLAAGERFDEIRHVPDQAHQAIRSGALKDSALLPSHDRLGTHAEDRLEGRL